MIVLDYLSQLVVCMSLLGVVMYMAYKFTEHNQ